MTLSLFVEVIHISDSFICFSIHKHLVREVVLYATFNYISICDLPIENTMNDLMKATSSRVSVMKILLYTLVFVYAYFGVLFQLFTMILPTMHCFVPLANVMDVK